VALLARPSERENHRYTGGIDEYEYEYEYE
jgi:hypothetical protein